MTIYYPADEVIWLQQQRGGYGFVTPVHSVVVKVGKARILIDAPLRKGGSKQVWVKSESLRPRSTKGA